MAAGQIEHVEVAAGERDRQRWATAHTPWPLGGFDRSPGQVPAHAAATPFPIAAPTPLLPPIAAQSTPDPGIQRLDARRRFCTPKGGVPPVEVTPQLTPDAYQRLSARAERPGAYLLLARLQGLLAHPAPVRPPPCERTTPKRPPPRPVPRTFGCVDRQLQAPRQESGHTGQHPLSGAYALDVPVALVRRAHEPVPSLFQLLVQTIPQQICQQGRHYTSYNVTKNVVEFSTSIPREQLRPGYGAGFLGAPLHMVEPDDVPRERERGGRHGMSRTEHDPDAGS